MKCPVLILLVATSLMISPLIHAHGEDKPGPNGGYIRMPGAFHTELLKVGNTKFKVFLLDIEWKNPTIKESFVTAIVKSKNKEETIKCKTANDVFECSLPKGWKWEDLSEINVRSNREKAQGVAVYTFPLKYGY